MSIAFSLSVQVSPGPSRNRGRRPVKPNPYYKYLRKIELSIKNANLGPNLFEKSQEMTNAIIRNFLDWYHSLGGKDITINEATLQKLFEIGFDKPGILEVAEEEQDDLYENKDELRPTNKRQLFSCATEEANFLWREIELWSVKTFADWLKSKNESLPPELKDCGLKQDVDFYVL